VAHYEELGAELAFYIALQEFAFEIAEESFPMHGVVGGDDAAAGNGVDDVDLVEQPSTPAAHLDFTSRSASIVP
jgi:hypothetical protein